MKNLLSVLLFFIPLSLWSQAFPGAEGYGAITRGAYSGSSEPAILIVDNLSPESFGDDVTGRGTFLWAITRSYPRIVMFEVSGIIDYRDRTSAITIGHPYMTIAGQTSPYEGIMLLGSNIIINRTNDILIQHIRVRVGNHNPMGSIKPEIRRGISIWNSSNIMIDHVSVSWAMRQLIEVGNASENVSVTNSLFAEPLHVAEWTRYTGTPANHGYGGLLRQAANLTLKNNLLAYGVYRNPSIKRHDNAVVINNFIYTCGDPTRFGIDPSGGGMIYDGEEGWTLRASIVGNVVLSTEATKASSGTSWKYVGQVTSDTDLNNEVYVDDNICDLLSEFPETPETDRWLIGKPGFVFQNASPIDLSKYTILSAAETEEHVIANAGAKPWYRDSTDERIVNQVTNRQGAYINSVYPRYARVFNWWLDGKGDMTNGFNWALNPTSIVVNGTTLTLNQNCANVGTVVNYLNTMMPAGTEAYEHYGTPWVGFRTLAIGAEQQITVSGPGLEYFGIRAGTYYGDDGVPAWEYDSATRALTDIAGYPANPHELSTDPQFTNLQIWLHKFPENETPKEENPEQFTLNIDIKGKGLVEANGEKGVNSISVDSNQTISIEAIPEPGWNFSNWEGDEAGNSNPLEVKMVANKIL